jgi:ribosomal protein S6
LFKKMANSFYELAFWIKLDVNPEEELKKIIELIKKYKGEVFYESGLKKRRMAYPIQKEIMGYFGYVLFNGTKETPVKVNEDLRFFKNVLRYLIVKRKVLSSKEKPENIPAENISQQA